MVGAMVSLNCARRNLKGFTSSPGQPTFKCTWLKALTVAMTSPAA